jgi:hypothetical protein
MRSYLKVPGDRLEETRGEVVREQPLTVWVDDERFLKQLDMTVCGSPCRDGLDLHAGEELSLEAELPGG